MATEKVDVVVMIEEVAILISMAEANVASTTSLHNAKAPLLFKRIKKKVYALTNT
jgi:hypothetical protein